ncbi:LADA_0D02828g1_1 [Lachancea dasiensis]|uniref:GPN-loop GTPase 2 n=1 Tax=Lachancea dasiensis TaxID=1072105 RepID=A0A1G4J4D8_9SACH|nr:LADA_0D02828g1_1 [Lachancea dasiensis]
MAFGQIVIGPPGSGKSTYCHGCMQFFNAIGRHAQVVNMDPANDRLPYPCAVDIRDFITLEEIMADAGVSRLQRGRQTRSELVNVGLAELAHVLCSGASQRLLPRSLFGGAVRDRQQRPVQHCEVELFVPVVITPWVVLSPRWC